MYNKIENRNTGWAHNGGYNKSNIFLLKCVGPQGGNESVMFDEW